MIIAVDPGKMTGIALAEKRYASNGFGAYDYGFSALMLPFDRDEEDFAAMDWIAHELQQHAHEGHIEEIVSESIIINKKTAQKSQDVLASTEQIGVMRWLCKQYGVPFSTQTPADGLGFGTDAKLRALDWWTPGPDHARAATRHLITRLCKLDSTFARELAVRLQS